MSREVSDHGEHPPDDSDDFSDRKLYQGNAED